MRVLLTIFWLFIIPVFAQAQSKKAFIIGVSEYDELTNLEKTIGDANGYSQVFSEDLGFEVTEAINPTRTEFLVQFEGFLESIEEGDQVSFIFSGHGWSDGALNYLAFTDAPIHLQTNALKFETVSFNERVLESIKEKNPSVVLAIIDACRDNPFDAQNGAISTGLAIPSDNIPEVDHDNSEEDLDTNESLTKSAGRGLRVVPKNTAQTGTLIIYSAGAGEVALDRLSENDVSPYSVFTRSLLPKLSDPNASLLRSVSEARDATTSAAQSVAYSQRPAIYSDISIDFCFADSCPSPFEALDDEKLRSGKLLADLFENAAYQLFSTENGDHTESILMALYARQYSNDLNDRSHYNLIDMIDKNALRRDFFGGVPSNSGIAFTADSSQFISAGSSHPNFPRFWDVETGNYAGEFKGHTEGVRAVAITADGTVLATGSTDGTAKLWDVDSGLEIAHFEGHSDGITSIAISEDGSRLATGGRDNQVKEWDIKSRKLVRSYEGNYVKLSSNSRILVAAGRDGTVHVHNTETEESEVRFVAHESGISSIAINGTGSLLATGSYDGTAKLWDATTGKLLQTFTRHEHWVLFIALAEDGSRLATSGPDNTVKIWNTESGELLQSSEGFGVAYSKYGDRLISGSSERGRGGLSLWNEDFATVEQVFNVDLRAANSLAVSSDGTRLAVSYNRGFVDTSKGRGALPTLWNLNNGEILQDFKGAADSISSFALSDDGAIVAIGSSNTNAAHLLEASTGLIVQSFVGHAREITSVALSQDGGRLVTGAQDQTARLWDTSTGEMQNSFEGHGGWISSVALTKDGSLLVTGSHDHTAKLWNTHTGAEVLTFEGHLGPVYAVAISEDETKLVTASSDGTARLWSLKGGDFIRSFDGHLEYVGSVAISKDGTRIATGSGDGTAKLWEVGSGNVLRSFDGHSRRVSSVAISGDGKYLATGDGEGRLRVWDLNPGLPIRSFDKREEGVRSIAISESANRIANGSNNGVVNLYDLKSDTLFDSFKDYSGPVVSLTMSQDASRLAKADLLYGPVTIWDTKNRTLLNTIPGITFENLSIALTENGEQLFLGRAHNEVELRDVASGEILRTFEGHSSYVTAIALSKRGDRLATGSGDRSAKLWDVENGEMLQSLEGHTDSIIAISISGDGKYVATGAADNTAKVWNSETGVLLHSFDGHSHHVGSVALSNDGTRLATGSKDRTAKIWNVESGALMQNLDGFEGAVTSVVFFDDGSRLVTGSEDGTTQIWDTSLAAQSLEDLIRTTCFELDEIGSKTQFSEHDLTRSPLIGEYVLGLETGFETPSPCTSFLEELE